MSEPNEITGFPEPHFAIHAVGIPAVPRSTAKPFCSRIPVRYLEVSTSCIPSSPNEKTWSIICWMRVARASTFVSASALSFSSRGSPFAAFACAPAVTNGAMPSPSSVPQRITRFIPRSIRGVTNMAYCATGLTVGYLIPNWSRYVLYRVGS